ncbi:MAG: IclR family transcriptional regulator [Burkholderiaceae bacterium]
MIHGNSNIAEPLSAVDSMAPPTGSAIMRAIEILEVISRSDETPQLAEICRAVNLPKATVYRILGTLEHAGYVSKEPGAKRYQCGHRLHNISMKVLQNSPARAARRAILEELVEELGETCNLTVPDVHTITYLDRVEASWPLKVVLSVGSKVPMYASASGKLFLSFMPRRSCERFIRSTPLIAYTEKTLVDPVRLMSELDSIRLNDFAVDEEEYLNGICCLAVPVRNHDGEVVASVAAHGPSSRMQLSQAIEFLPQLREAADCIGQTLES